MAEKTPNIIEQIKQGDSNALENFFNNKLSAKGITAKVSVKNNCLRILFQSNQSLPKQSLVNSTQKVISKLNHKPWEQVRIYGQKIGEEIPDWVEVINLEPLSNQSVEERAKQGDVNAISSLVNQKLKEQEIAAKVSFKDYELRIMLESGEAPDQEKMIYQIKEVIDPLQIPNLKTIQLYGKEKEEEFPDWHHQIRPKEKENNTEKQSQSQEEESQNIENTKEIDEVFISNKLYNTIVNKNYKNLEDRVNSEDDKNLKELVKDFTYNLESDLRDYLEDIPTNIFNITQEYSINLKEEQIRSIVFKESNFTPVKSAINELQKASDEVEKLDISEEEDISKELWKAITDSGAEVGATVGSFIVPGIGTVVGGIIGRLFSSQKEQEHNQAVIENYQKTRSDLFEAWHQFLGNIYNRIKTTFQEYYSIQMLSCETLNQAVNYNEQAQKYYDNNQFQDAIQLYDQAIQLNSQSLKAWFMKGLNLIALNRYEEAVETLHQAIKFKNIADSNIEHIIYLELGYAFQELGYYDSAIQSFDQCLYLINSNDNLVNRKDIQCQALAYKCDTLDQKGAYEECIKICDRLILLLPENYKYRFWYEKARYLAILGNSNEAIEALRKAISLNKGETQRLAYQDTNFDNIRNYEEFKALVPDPNSCLQEGLRQFQLGNYENAIEYYNQTIQIDANIAIAYTNRGGAYLNQGKLDQALEDLNQAIQIDPNIAVAYQNRGVVYLEQGKLEKALEDLNQAIQINSTNTELYYRRGLAYLEQGNFNRALEDFSQAIQIDPTFAGAYANRGATYIRQGNQEKAIQDFEKAANLAQKQGNTQLHQDMQERLNQLR